MAFFHNAIAVLSLLEAPGDNLCKSTPAKQVVVAAIVILSNICRAWTMYLCMDSVKFLLEAPGASILWGATILWRDADPFWGTSIRTGASNRDITVYQALRKFPTQRPVTRSFDVYFDLRLNKRLCKPSWGWWFETLLCPLWCHSNVKMAAPKMSKGHT